MNISKPNVRNVKRGVVPSNGIVGDYNFVRTYRATSKTDPKSTRKPAMRFINSTTSPSIEKLRCSMFRIKSCCTKAYKPSGTVETIIINAIKMGIFLFHISSLIITYDFPVRNVFLVEPILDFQIVIKRFFTCLFQISTRLYNFSIFHNCVMLKSFSKPIQGYLILQNMYNSSGSSFNYTDHIIIFWH